jgi:capsular polysaccharide biosynthesis protein
MEIDEIAARLLRQYWALMLLCIAVPVLAIGLTAKKQAPMYAASARLDSGITVPASNAQAQAIVSQIQGIATGKTVAAKALHDVGVTRNLIDFVNKDISVTGLGGSQVVDLTVTDRSPQVAAALAKVLASEVVTSINSVGQSGLSAALSAIDQEIVRYSEQRSVLAAQVAADPKNQQLQAKLTGLDQVLGSFSGDRSRLLIQASSQGLSTVLDQPVVPLKPQSKALMQKLGLAGLLGLVAGILIASIAETIRPTVPGARRVSRRLGAPALGQLRSADMRGERTPDLENLALRLRLAATHADVSTVALVDVNGEHELADLAHSLERCLKVSTQSMATQAGGADDNNHQGSLSGGSAYGTLRVKDRQLTTEHQALRVCTMAQLTHLGDMSRVGLLVVSGPVARVSRVMALDDLVTASGWPIIGVVGVPRLPRRRSGLFTWRGGRDAQVSLYTETPASPAETSPAEIGDDGEGRAQ